MEENHIVRHRVYVLDGEPTEWRDGDGEGLYPKEGCVHVEVRRFYDAVEVIDVVDGYLKLFYDIDILRNSEDRETILKILEKRSE